MNRCLEPEWLDELPETDPKAQASRRDLRRLNWWMGHVGTAARTLRQLRQQDRPLRLIELGSGDGDFLACVGEALGAKWQATRATLLDRQDLMTETTARRFHELGWHLDFIRADVMDWCREMDSTRYDIILTNLFLHHFDSTDLPVLLAGLCKKCDALVALEPRRSRWSLAFSSLVGLIGCNAVTRHDAPASVRAGFRTGELTQLTPSDWTVHERSAGPFSQLFVARCAPK
jgi:hypothetical protein